MVQPVSSAMVVVRLAKVVELVLDDLGMTVNQYRALTLIEAGAPPMREFALRLAMQPPNLSTLIDGLVRRGLVARRRDPTDGRRVVFSLTVRGRAHLDRAETRTGAALARVASYDHEHQRALLAGIDDWQLALDRIAADLHAIVQTRTNTQELHTQPRARASA